MTVKSFLSDEINVKNDPGERTTFIAEREEFRDSIWRETSMLYPPNVTVLLAKVALLNKAEALLGTTIINVINNVFKNKSVFVDMAFFIYLK